MTRSRPSDQKPLIDCITQVSIGSGATIDEAELTAITKALEEIANDKISATEVNAYIDRQNLVGSWVKVKTPKFKHVNGEIVRSGRIANDNCWDALADAVNALKVPVKFIWMTNQHDRTDGGDKLNKQIPDNNPAEPSYAASFNGSTLFGVGEIQRRECRPFFK